MFASVVLCICRAWRVVSGGLQALFEGFWLGVLSERIWDAMTERSYGSGREYTNPEYLDSGLWFWEDLAIRRFFAAGSKILVAGAGGGREVIALSRMGFHADGFECSRRMVEAGVEALAARSIVGTLTWAPPCCVPPLTRHTYDGVVIGWNAYSYIVPRDRRIRFLKDLTAAIKPGSPVLLSGGFRPGKPSGLAKWTPRIANFFRTCTLRQPAFEPGASFSTRPRQDFSKGQVKEELLQGDLELKAWYVWGPYFAVAGTSVRN